jgi:hypothetical protein
LKNILRVVSPDGQVLFECSQDERERAYAFAKEMEALGIEVSLSAPSLPESLALELGMNDEEAAELRDELDEEVDSHDSCCLK